MTRRFVGLYIPKIPLVGHRLHVHPIFLDVATFVFLSMQLETEVAISTKAVAIQRLFRSETNASEG